MSNSYSPAVLNLTANTPIKVSGLANAWTIISASLDVTAVQASVDGGTFSPWPFGLGLESQDKRPFPLWIQSTITQTVTLAQGVNIIFKDNRFAPGVGSLGVTGAAAAGAAPSGAPVLMAGQDGTPLVRVVLTDAAGRQVVVGNSANGAAIAGNPVPVAGVDVGGTVRSLRTDTNGCAQVGGLVATGNAIGGAANPVRIAGSDGANLHDLLTDTSGRALISGAAAAGAAVAGNPVRIGGNDGGTTRDLKSDPLGRLIIRPDRAGTTGGFQSMVGGNIPAAGVLSVAIALAANEAANVHFRFRCTTAGTCTFNILDNGAVNRRTVPFAAALGEIVDWNCFPFVQTGTAGTYTFELRSSGGFVGEAAIEVTITG